MTSLRSVEWLPATPGTLLPGHVRILDQTRLPGEIAYVDTDDIERVHEAIRFLRVRGAPAIGVAAAMGLAAALQHVSAQSGTELESRARALADRLRTSRPTAVNLFWAIDRMETTLANVLERSVPDIKEALVREAIAIRDEDAEMCRRIGYHGASLLEDGVTVLTHCNAGGLATAEFGTALAPVYTLHEAGKTVHVFADETRPLLQGARLTAWELLEAGVDVTVICDNTAAQVMREGKIDAVLVGADRIASNGDAANKIGTYGLAVLAAAHSIPFYVLAPSSTLDASLASGDSIPIEYRAAEEVTCGFGRRTAPEGVTVYSPAFDVTPASLIDAIVCEKGVLRAPYAKSIASSLADPYHRHQD